MILPMLCGVIACFTVSKLVRYINRLRWEREAAEWFDRIRTKAEQNSPTLVIKDISKSSKYVSKDIIRSSEDQWLDSLGVKGVVTEEQDNTCTLCDENVMKKCGCMK